MQLSEKAFEVRKKIEHYQRSTEFLKLTETFANNPDNVSGLVELVSSDEKHPFPQYSSHLLLHIARLNPANLESHYNKILDFILLTKNTSLKRNLLGVLLCFDLKEYRDGELLDWLFDNLSKADSQPGLINYSVRKLVQFIDIYPELQNEVETAIKLREELGMNRGLTEWSVMVFNKKVKTKKKA
jgi:hypothetical protein